MSLRDGKWYRSWPKKNTYMSSWAKLKSRADAGCVWCRLLLDLDVAQDDDPDKTVTITVRGGGLTKKCHDESGPYQKHQEVEVDINENATSMIIYAAPGALGRYIPGWS